MSDVVSAQPNLPCEELLPAWRAAVLAWRRTFREARHPSPAYKAALAAFREVLPDMRLEEADRQMMLAIAYAAGNHTKWFWGSIYRH